jgi:hypothetical protein
MSEPEDDFEDLKEKLQDDIYVEQFLSAAIQIILFGDKDES